MAPEKVVRDIIVASIAAALVGTLDLAVHRMTGLLYSAIVAVVAAAALAVALLRYWSMRGKAMSYETQLRSVGIRSIHENYRNCPPVSDLISAARHDIAFLGITARTFFEAPEIEEAVKKKMREGIYFRFLLLNPESRYLEPQAQGEGADPNAWRSDIDGSISRLLTSPLFSLHFSMDT